MPNKLPIMGRISILPKLGELLYNLNNNYVRKFTLKSTFLFNSENITDQFFDILTRFHKIAGSTEVMLQVTRKQFFDKLSNEIKSLGTKNIPTLIVWGKEEKSIPLPVGKELVHILSHSRFEILNNAGHCSNIDQFELFNQLVLDFLESN
jgi:pimeloyl-ACP methyl ester carboxylesterase